jgi:NADH dehydrogenase FAD-containing subunit
MSSEAPEVVPAAAAPAETAPETKAPADETPAPAPAVTKNVVVLGASYAGLSAAHYFLKYVLPTLPNKEAFTLTLVGTSSKFHARPPTPRAVASHKLMPANKIFYDIAGGFKKYPAGQFTFVQGTATSLDEKAKTVTVSLPSGETQNVSYTGLIIATGTRTATPILGLHGDYTETENAQRQFQEALPNAKTIVIAGGGPAAVETAGEIAELLNGKPGFFGGVKKKADITIITSDSKLLPQIRPAIAAAAATQLQKLGVEVVYNTKVESVAPETAGISNITEKATLTLSTGETKEADLYIPATGVSFNSQFLPTHLLNAKGQVLTNPTTFRVDEAGKGVFAVGDVSSAASWGIMDIYSGIPVVLSNLKRDLSAPDGETPAGPDRPWKANTKETQIVTIGTKGGVGAMFGFKLPGFMVKVIKGGDMFASRAPAIVDGSHWSKESKWNGQ